MTLKTYIIILVLLSIALSLLLLALGCPLKSSAGTGMVCGALMTLSVWGARVEVKG